MLGLVEGTVVEVGCSEGTKDGYVEGCGDGCEVVDMLGINEGWIDGTGEFVGSNSSLQMNRSLTFMHRSERGQSKSILHSHWKAKQLPDKH